MRNPQRIALISLAASTLILATGYFASAPARERREVARQKHCLDNLRQLWSASMMYARDYDGWMPIYRNDNHHTPKQHAGSDIWAFPAPPKLRSSLGPYIRDSSIWFCPSDKDAGKNTTKGSADHQYSSYVYHFLAPGLLRSDGVVLSRVPKRWTGSMTASGSPYRYTLIQDDDSASRFLGMGALRMHGIHLGRDNLIRLDGHALSIRPY